MGRHLIVALLIISSVAGGTARAQADQSGVIAARCSADYNGARAALRQKVGDDLRFNRGAELTVDAHDLAAMDANCFAKVRVCETVKDCPVTPEYVVRSRYLELDLAFLNDHKQRGNVQPNDVSKVIGEAEFICAQYWVTEDARTGHDAEADATLVNGLAVVQQELRENRFGLRDSILEYDRDAPLWKPCADSVGAQ